MFFMAQGVIVKPHIKHFFNKQIHNTTADKPTDLAKIFQEKSRILMEKTQAPDSKTLCYREIDPQNHRQ